MARRYPAAVGAMTGRARLAVLGVLAAVGALQVAGIAWERLTDPVPPAEGRPVLHGSWTDDFVQDYVSARAIADRDDPYGATDALMDRYVGEGWERFHSVPDGQTNPHPPAQVLTALPLAWASYQTARVVWLVLNAMLLATSMGLFVRALGASRAEAALGGIAVLALPVAARHLWLGQSNAVILLLLVLAWRALRSGKGARAGIALGLAAALRLFPLFLVIPLLRRRALRPAAIAVGVAALGTATGFAAAGFGSAGSFLEGASANVAFWRGSPGNASLLALPVRWLTGDRWGFGVVDAPVLALTLVAAAAAACVLAASRTPARSSGEGFWAAVPWMLLAAPLFWDHYMVLLIPAATLALRTRLRHSGPWTLACIVAAALVALGEPRWAPRAIGDASVVDALTTLALPAYGTLALAATEWGPAGEEP